MKNRPKVVYYTSFLLFLIGIVASRASIVNVASPYSIPSSDNYALCALLVLVTLGLGAFTFYGLVRKKSPNQLPKALYVYGKLSIWLAVALILIVILLFLWLVFSNPHWGYGLMESSKYVH